MDALQRSIPGTASAGSNYTRPFEARVAARYTSGFTEHRIEIVCHGAKYPVEFPVLKPVPVTYPHAGVIGARCGLASVYQGWTVLLSDPMLVAVGADRLAPRFEI
jgi:hypothetical protein